MEKIAFKKIKSGKFHILMDNNSNVYIIDKDNKVTKLGKYRDFDYNQNYLVLLDNNDKIYFYNTENDIFDKINVVLNNNNKKINKIGCYGEALVMLDEDGVIWYEDLINRDVLKCDVEKFVDISTSFLLFHAKSENGNLYGYGANEGKQLHPLISNELCIDEMIKINCDKVKNIFTNQHISFYTDENDLLHILTNDQGYYDKTQHYINNNGEVVLKDIKVKKVVNYFYNIFLLDDKNNLHRYILTGNNGKPTYSLCDTGIDCLDISLYKHTLLTIGMDGELYICNDTMFNILKFKKLLSNNI